MICLHVSCLVSNSQQMLKLSHKGSITQTRGCFVFRNVFGQDSVHLQHTNNRLNMPFTVILRSITLCKFCFVGCAFCLCYSTSTSSGVRSVLLLLGPPLLCLVLGSAGAAQFWRQGFCANEHGRLGIQLQTSLFMAPCLCLTSPRTTQRKNWA